MYFGMQTGNLQKLAHASLFPLLPSSCFSLSLTLSQYLQARKRFFFLKRFKLGAFNSDLFVGLLVTFKNQQQKRDIKQKKEKTHRRRALAACEPSSGSHDLETGKDALRLSWLFHLRSRLQSFSKKRLCLLLYFLLCRLLFFLLLVLLLLLLSLYPPKPHSGCSLLQHRLKSLPLPPCHYLSLFLSSLSIL